MVIDKMLIIFLIDINFNYNFFMDKFLVFKGNVKGIYYFIYNKINVIGW